MNNQNNTTLQKIIILVLSVIIIFFAYLFLSPHLTQEPLPAGILAPADPIQTKHELPAPITKEEFTILPLANFSLEGKILSKKRYFLGKEAALSPVDFAMGWGAMSDKNIVKKIKISQHGRWYYWKAKRFPIPRREIETHSANMHLIPANKEVKKALLKADEGQIVKFSGYLVKVIAPDWSWKSSLTRKDTGNHACEVVYVKTFNVIY